MAHKRPFPSQTRRSLRVKERSNGVESPSPSVPEMQLPKRRRSHRSSATSVQPLSNTSSLTAQPESRLLPGSQASFSPGFPPMVSPDSSYQESSGPFFRPGDSAWDVPRVASSAHINELVAKYSSPYSAYRDHDSWLHSAGLVPDLSDLSLSMYSFQEPPDLLEAQMSASAVEEFYHDSLGTQLPHLTEQLETLPAGERPSNGQSARSVDTFFEDLADLAANAGTPQAERDHGFVEGLALQEDTKLSVEQWLRDSPEAPHGLSATPPEGKGPGKEERSLPHWVLEELGEGSEECQGEQAVQGVARTGSSRSSTNAPTLKGDRREACGEGDSRDRGSDSAGTVSAHTSIGGKDDVQKKLRFEEEELSVHSSLGEKNLLDDMEGWKDDAEAVGVSNMSRSFSTTWMKDLLEDCDTFKDQLCIGEPWTSSVEVAPVLASAPHWEDDHFAL